MEIKVNKIENLFNSSPVISSSQFGIDETNFSHITRLLSKSLYTNPIRTLMTEYVQNALDAHKENNSNKKVCINLPTVAYPYYEVEDFGNGMSPEFVLNKLTKYGCSTKSSSNNQAGGFGIGFKASAIYCDVFQLTVYYNGYEYLYNVTNHEGNGNISLISKEKTDRENGTLISIYANNDDHNSFYDNYKDGLYDLILEKIKVTKHISETNIQDITNERQMDCIYEQSEDSWRVRITKNNVKYIKIYSSGIYINTLTIDEYDHIQTILADRGLKFFDNYKDISNTLRNTYTEYLCAPTNYYHKNCILMDINIPVGKFEMAVNRESFIKTDEYYMYIAKCIYDMYQLLFEHDKQIINTITNDISLKDAIEKYNHLLLPEHTMGDIKYTRPISNLRKAYPKIIETKNSEFNIPFKLQYRYLFINTQDNPLFRAKIIYNYFEDFTPYISHNSPDKYSPNVYKNLNNLSHIIIVYNRNKISRKTLLNVENIDVCKAVMVVFATDEKNANDIKTLFEVMYENYVPITILDYKPRQIANKNNIQYLISCWYNRDINYFINSYGNKVPVNRLEQLSETDRYFVPIPDEKYSLEGINDYIKKCATPFIELIFQKLNIVVNKAEISQNTLIHMMYKLSDFYRYKTIIFVPESRTKSSKFFYSKVFNTKSLSFDFTEKQLLCFLLDITIQNINRVGLHSYNMLKSLIKYDFNKIFDIIDDTDIADYIQSKYLNFEDAQWIYDLCIYNLKENKYKPVRDFITFLNDNKDNLSNYNSFIYDLHKLNAQCNFTLTTDIIDSIITKYKNAPKIF